MGVMKIIDKGLALAVTAAVSSGITYWLCTDRYERAEAELRDRVAELRDRERSSMVTRRISEQMEDIAFQQKAISDQQRERAEKQSLIADMERGKAEMERSLAREAERQAVRSARQADSMRLLAEFQTLVATQERQDALAARAKADTLFYNSLGKLLAQNSVAQYSAGTTDLASLLSFASWHYTRTYGGDVYQQDVFTSLLHTAGNSMQLTGTLQGSVRSMAWLGNGGGTDAASFVAVSDYGEIALLKAARGDAGGTARYQAQTLFADSRYVFRDVKTDSVATCYALDVTGRIVCQDVHAPRVAVQPLLLPAATWEHLLRKADGTLVAVANDRVAWIDPQCRRVLHTEEVKEGVAEAGLMDDELVLCCNTGRIAVFNGYKEARSVPVTMPRGETVTAFEYLADRGWLVLGTETGPVYVFDRNGRLLNALHGHTGRITHLERMSWMLVSSSYDHTLRLWDVRDIASLMTPVNISYDRWPLCFAVDGDQKTLRVGMEGGDIRSVSVSVEKNAESTRRAITREFTKDEWRYYIGKEVPYRTFMDYMP